MTDNNVLDSVIPPDFPRDIFNAVFLRVFTVNDQKFQSPHFYAFHDSSLAVSYRFFACSDYDIGFTESITRSGINPPRLEHYIQERELFGFFLSGLASLESFAYSSYALGAILDEKQFPMGEPRNITISSTSEKFDKYYKGETLTSKLNELINSQELKSWSSTRNILAHRLMPAREHRITILGQSKPLKEEVWILGNIQINNDTTSIRRKWLVQVLTDLIGASDDFTRKYYK